MAAPPLTSLHIDRPALDAACARLALRLVVLYGSHATGEPPAGPDSDVDLALGFERGAEREGWWECHEALRAAFPGAPLDIAFLADADPLFRWEIMRQGKLLWGDPMDYLEYRAFAFRDFVDSADLRALEGRLFDRKMALIHERLRAAS
jgi:predicted nucleotidyltransferase